MAGQGLLIFEPPGSSWAEWTKLQGTPLVDIVMVHGLNGGRLSPWTHGELPEEVCWPRDLLYEKIPSARIMTFGYNSKVLFNSDTSKIRDYSKKLLTQLRDKRDMTKEVTERPLVFICHSLGGLVVKKALILASFEAEYREISTSTKGIVFFGTPHRGSSIASLGKIISRVAGFARTRSDLLQALETNQDGLQEIAENFIAVVSTHRYKVKSFYESDKLQDIKLVVTKESAVMNISEEEAIPMDGDHREICRFSKDDDRFEAVWKAVQRCLPTEAHPLHQGLSSLQRRFIETLPGHDATSFLNSQEQPENRSCNWIPSHHLFQKWLTSTENHVLHVVGEPGSGKSTAAAWLFNTGDFWYPGRRALIFSFQSRRGRCHASDAWGSLTYQNLQSGGSFSAVIHNLLNEESQRSRWGSRSSSTKAVANARLRELFRYAAVESSGSVPAVYIIDALDECNQELNEFLKSLVDILGMLSSQVPKILLLSRHILPWSVDTIFESAGGTLRIDMNAESLHIENVQRYIEAKVDDLCKVRPGLSEFRGEMTSELYKRSSGIYLLPSLTLKSLTKSKSTPANIRSVLRSLPGDLEAIYADALDKVAQQDRERVAALLLWVVFALRPLNVSELSVAVAVCCQTAPFTTEVNLDAEVSRDLLGESGVCDLVGPIIKITAGNIVSLVHSSAREYLLKIASNIPIASADRHRHEWVWQSFVKRENGLEDRRFELASRSSEILLSHCQELVSFACRSSLMASSAYVAPDEPGEPCEPIKSAIRSLLKYAIESIPDHARPCQDYHSFKKFIKSEAGSKWMKQFWKLADPSQNYKDFSPLEICCALGLVRAVKILGRHYPTLFGLTVEKEAREVMEEAPDLLSAVDVAAMFGNVDVLTILCTDFGIPVNSDELVPDTMSKVPYRPPAVRESGPDRKRPRLGPRPKNPRMAEDARAEQARVEGKFSSYRPLHTAIMYGQSEAVKRLLSLGSDLLCEDNDGHCAIELAMEKNVHHILPILLPLYDKAMGKLLLRLMRGEKLGYIQRLVELRPGVLRNGMQIGQTMCPALHLAAAVGKLSVFKLLLSLGAAVDAVDSQGRRVIHYAASTAQIDVVEHISGLETHCLVSGDDSGRNTLYYAARGLSCVDGALTELSSREQIMSALIQGVSKKTASFAVGSALGSLATETRTFCAWSPENRQSFEASIVYLSNLTKVVPCPGFLHLAFMSDGFPLEVALAVCVNSGEVDANNRTALHNAAIVSRPWGGFHAQLARQLANIDSRDSEGKTVIQLVLEGPSPNTHEIPNRLKVLLDAGADPKGKSNNDHPLLVVAAKRLLRRAPPAMTNVQELPDGTLAPLLERGAPIGDLDELMLWQLLNVLGRTGREGDLATMLRALSSEQKGRWLEAGIIEVPPPAEMVVAASRIDWRREALADLTQHLGGAELDRLQAQILETRLPALADFWRSSDSGFLLQPGGGSFRKLEVCAQMGDVDSLAYFLDSMGGAVDSQDPHGRTLLSLAAGAGQAAAVKWLLSRGASNSVFDREGRSPVNWAAREGSVDAVCILLEAGVKVTKMDIKDAKQPSRDIIFKYLQESWSNQREV